MKNKLNVLVSMTSALINQTTNLMPTLTGKQKKLANSLINTVKPIQAKLQKFQTPAVQAAIPANQPKAKVQANTADLFQPIFQKNGNQAVAYGIKTHSQMKKVKTIIATAVKFGYTMAIGVTTNKLSIVVAPKGAKIPTKLFVNGYCYPTMIKTGTLVGLPGALMVTKAGANLVHAVKHVSGMKTLIGFQGTVQNQPAKTATQTPKTVKPAQVAHKANGVSKPKAKLVNQLDPMGFSPTKSQQAPARAN